MNTDYYACLYNRHRSALLTYATLRCTDKTTAEDIVQQAFLKLLEKESLQTIENIKGYLFIMVRNEIMNMLRAKARELKVLSEVARRQSHMSSYDTLEEKEYRKLLRIAVDQLTVRRKIAYSLNFELGWSRDEIATRLNVSPMTAKNLLAIARADVREYISSMVA